MALYLSYYISSIHSTTFPTGQSYIMSYPHLALLNPSRRDKRKQVKQNQIRKTQQDTKGKASKRRRKSTHTHRAKRSLRLPSTTTQLVPYHTPEKRKLQAHYRALLAAVVPTSGGSYVPENKLISQKPTTPYTKVPRINQAKTIQGKGGIQNSRKKPSSSSSAHSFPFLSAVHPFPRKLHSHFPGF